MRWRSGKLVVIIASKRERLAALAAGALTPPPGRPRIALAVMMGVVTHLAFAAAVLAMIVAMAFGMSRSFGRVPWPWAALANAALLLQFPLGHSLLLGPAGRKLLARLVPGEHGRTLATTTYALIASVQLGMVFALWTPSGIVWWQARGWLLGPVLAAYAGAWLLLLKAICDAGLELQVGALGWLSLLKNAPVRFPDMPREGLFALIRQPIYVAFALTLWTVPVWTPDQLALAAGFTGYCILAPLRKEARFAGMYGDRFHAYRAQVPYMVPGFAARPRPVNDLTIYDAVADRWWSDEVRWVRTLANLVPARLVIFDRAIRWPGVRVLDLGCAGGFMSEALARRGAQVTGMDPAAGAIAAARRHAAAVALDIRYDIGTGEALPYGDAAFDAVVCVDVLEHVSDLPLVLAEVARVLRPGGLFLFDTVNRTRVARFVMVTLAEDALRLLPRGTHDPARFLRPAELRARLESAGFSVGALTGLGPRGLTPRGDFVFGRVPGTAIIYAGTARKRPGR